MPRLLRSPYGLVSIATLLFLQMAFRSSAAVIINEIHYDPDVKIEQVEFIELYNTSPNAVDLTGWAFTEGVQYTFPAGVSIAGGGYVVVTEDIADFQAKFGFAARGPFTGSLDNDGETIVLRDAAGQVVDEVDYQLGFPWPTVGEAPGLSIELAHPSLDNNLGGSWRASLAGNFSTGNTNLFNSGSSWKYLKGTAEASTPRELWRQPGYNDATWLNGTAPIGYGENFIATVLSDMSGLYTSVYFRKTFVVDDPSQVTALTLEAQYDDGLKVWINGTNVVNGNANLPVGELNFNATASSAIENLNFVTLALNAPTTFLKPGTNVIAVQGHNSALSGSSDFFFDARLVARIGGGTTGRGPTPNAANTVFSTNLPPQVRQVDHEPEQPRGGDVVNITARVTDPDGVGSVTLQYQVVVPGSYITLTDAAYTNSWVTLPMNDSGSSGDAAAGDSVYTAQIAATNQVHRRLIRYRIMTVDGTGRSLRVPYEDDPQPNFAYFVYNGVPEWRGSIQPGVAPVLTYPTGVMGRLPVYHLLSKRSDVETATWNEKYTGDLYKWAGTLVYDGKVYDHVHYRMRGGVWRYAMGKNMWKFKLNRGHELEARDNWGRKFSRPWTRLNFSAGIQQADGAHRGEQGMFESVGFKLFNLGGVESPHTAFSTFRIIDDAAEANANNQFEGDFWGLYTVIEQEDGRFLDEHGLPDGNLYKMENGTGPGNGELKNQGPTQVTDSSDLTSFVNSLNGQTDQWWRDHLDLPKYFNYQTIVQAIHHFDICCGKNYYYYHNPITDKWEVHTWDLDLTWADNQYVNGVSGGTEPFRSPVLSDFSVNPARPQIMMEFKNRVREIRDLLYNADQAFEVIDEFGQLLRGTNSGPTIVDADRAQWDYNPVMINSAIVNLSKAGHGLYYRFPNEAVTRDFNGLIQLLKNYVVYRSTQAALSPAGSGLDGLARDTAIPSKPVVTPIGPGTYPLNRLSFRVSDYSGVAGFAALKWRLAAITPTNGPASNPNEPNRYEIESSWESPDLTSFTSDINIPSFVVRAGQTYRVRARFKDLTGRWSHWSAPIQFVAGEPDSAAAMLAYLRISELMFNSPGGSEYDFVELHNLSPDLSLELNGAKFTQGIDYTFGPGQVVPPQGYLLVVNTTNHSAFRAYYGLGTNVALVGPYSGNLANNGEQLTLRTSAGGTDISAFVYADGRGWPLAADGTGHSLVPLPSQMQEQATGGLGYGGNWRASAYIKGSPGSADPAVSESILLNEVVAHTDFTTEFDSNDWIELFNPGATDFTFGPGWFLSDDGNPTNLTKWMIPAGTVVPAGGFVSFDEQTGFHNPTNIGFGLNKDGEQIFLSHLTGTSQDRVVDSVSFKGQENDWSLGRFPDGGVYWYALQPRTRGSTNAVPGLHAVISEIMYHPPDIGGMDNSLDEFVEILNPTATPLALFDTNGNWRLDGGISFSFPSNLTLAPMGYLVVVNFDPTNSAQLAAFRSTYLLSGTDQLIVGPYSGKLGNGSQRVALEKPQAPDLPGEGSSWVIVDEVIYADRSPWQLAADGFGPSLHRQDLLRHGNDPSNWQAAGASVAAPYAGGTPPSISTQPSPASRISPAGLNLTYSVSAVGTMPLQYLWRLNGNTLDGQRSAVLTLTNVQPAQSGNYSVLVLNSAGSVLSDSVNLLVTTPPVIQTHPASMTVRPGTNVTLTVLASGTGAVSYQWRQDGQDISGAISNTYALSNVTADDDGVYTVVVSDMNGSVVSEAARFIVLIAPSIVAPPISQAVLAGSTVTFSVQSAGSLPMGYRWRKGGQFQGFFELESHTAFFVITNVQATHAGSYAVVVTNEANRTGVLSTPAAVLTVLVDTDGDGMDDDWENLHGFDRNSASDAGLDADGDGLTNKQEYDAATDPNDPESYLKIDEVSADFVSLGAVSVRFEAAASRTYTVQSREVLVPGPWSRVADVVAASTNRMVEILDQPAVGINRRYYRLVTPRVP